MIYSLPRRIKILFASAIGALGIAASVSVGANTATLSEIPSLEDAYFASNGKYLEVWKGNTLPDYTTDTLSKNIPAGAEIHIYESPRGHGYQIIYEDAEGKHSVGYGPEAFDRTYTEAKFVSSTSTPK